MHGHWTGKDSQQKRWERRFISSDLPRGKSASMNIYWPPKYFTAGFIDGYNFD